MSILDSFAIRRKKVFLSLSRNDNAKIFVQYILISFVSFLVGVSVCRVLPETVWTSLEQAISIHFEIPFRHVQRWQEVLLLILRYAKFDLLCIGVLFICSFTIVTLPLCELAMACQSGSLGVAVGLLIQVKQVAAYPPSNCEVGCFIGFRLLLFLLFVLYAVYTVSFADSFKIGVERGRTVFHYKKLLPFILHTVVFSGTVLLLIAGYCLMTVIL